MRGNILFVFGEITTGCGPSIPGLRGQHVVGINLLSLNVFFFFQGPNYTSIKITKPRQTASASPSVLQLLTGLHFISQSGSFTVHLPLFLLQHFLFLHQKA